VELGCGGSRWVPYLARTFDCESWGIDYSQEGLRLTEQACRAEGMQCRLVFGDVFDESLLPDSYFDFVYSMGFIEHFRDPSQVTRRIARLLRPRGRVLTTLPNLTGIYGKLQQRADPEVFAKHVILAPQQLDEAHEAACLMPLERAHFFGCFGPGVVSYAALERQAWGLGRMILPAVQVLQQTACWGLRALHADFESDRFSPYIAGIYEKVDDPEPC